MLRDILEVEDHNRVVSVLFAYLFGRIDKYEYRDLIGEKGIQQRVWAAAEGSGYVLKNCKLFAYAYHCNQLKGRVTSPAKYGIDARDVSILRKLNLRHIHRDYRSMSMAEFENLESSILSSKEFQDNIGKFINKKLLFLHRHYGQDRVQLRGHLQERALYALRKQYPCYASGLHAMNICKTAARNAGQGLIEYWTRKKRNALIREDDGTFQAVHVPFDSLHMLSVPPEHADPVREGMQSLVALSHRMKPKVRTFIEIAAGQPHDGFSAYLGIDNSKAACDWTFERYIGKVQDYLQVRPDQVQSLMIKLRGAMT